MTTCNIPDCDNEAVHRAYDADSKEVIAEYCDDYLKEFQEEVREQGYEHEF